ncbi:MAG: diguanylate cyclase [Desulfobacteraceae bacterium]|nr:MAG: diguanylate cyclase [Desulfobacteraceae bacterium]
MSILVVDDSPTIRSIIKSYLNDAGHQDLLFAESARDAFRTLGIDPQGGSSPGIGPNIDLILLDIVLPDMDGREVCRLIKSAEYLRDIPVITVTSLIESEHLEKAFAAGATDYITKPINKIELLARIRSALKLKYEMDRRKAREQKLLEVTRQLEEAVEKLDRLSSLDGLTGIKNRRCFDEHINQEWQRGLRNARPLSLILIDIDFFKAYNDTYGHQAGDECLKAVAGALRNVLNRPGDLVCRYGGEEFAVILPETPRKGAVLIAETMRARVQSTGIIHESSQIANQVTISLGVATTLPARDLSPAELISAADRALYDAKRGGRNQARTAGVEHVNN